MNRDYPLRVAWSRLLENFIADANALLKATDGRARQEEREACAKIVENYCGAWDDAGYALAQAIRARGADGNPSVHGGEVT